MPLSAEFYIVSVEAYAPMCIGLWCKYRGVCPQVRRSVLVEHLWRVLCASDCLYRWGALTESEITLNCYACFWTSLTTAGSEFWVLCKVDWMKGSCQSMGLVSPFTMSRSICACLWRHVLPGNDQIVEVMHQHSGAKDQGVSCCCCGELIEFLLPACLLSIGWQVVV